MKWGYGKIQDTTERVDCTVIHFLRVIAKFGTCIVESVNWTLVEAKLCTFTLECTHFIFN
jgi:hypothetical protein